MDRAFAECGAAAWLILLLAVAALVVSIASLVLAPTNPRAARAASIAGLVLVGLVAASGVLGTYLGRASTDRAAITLASAHRDAIRVEGYREAEQCTRVAGFADVAPLLLAFAALIVSGRARHDGTTAGGGRPPGTDDDDRESP